MGSEIVHVNHVGTVTFSELQKMAEAVAKSNLFSCRTPEAALTLMLLAQAENIHPIQAMRQYHIIENRPSMRADAMQARFQAAGGRVKWLKRTDQEVSAEFSHPEMQPNPIVVTWDDEKVKRAGLMRGNHEKYALAMKSARVISEGVRAVLPEVVVGIYTPEEVRDFDEPREPTRPREGSAREVQSVKVKRTDDTPTAQEREPESPTPPPESPTPPPESPTPPPESPTPPPKSFTMADAKQAALSRGITPAEADQGIGNTLLAMKLTPDTTPSNAWQTIVAGIQKGKCDKWKGSTTFAAAPPDITPAALDQREEDVHQTNEDAYFDMLADDFKIKVLWPSAQAVCTESKGEKGTKSRAKFESGLAKYLKGANVTLDGMDGAAREELAGVIAAGMFDFEHGKVADAAVVC